MSGKSSKSWLSPFMAVSYGAVAVTGGIMLLHIKSAGLYTVHKWGGLLFVFAGLAHLMLNWRIFTSYFKNSRAIWGSCVGVVILLFLAVTFPSGDHHNYRDGLGNRHKYEGGPHRRY